MTTNTDTRLFSLLMALICMISFPVLYAGKAAAATEEPEHETSAQIADKIAGHYRQFDSLGFSFTQQTKGQMTGRPKTGKGNALFVKDGQTTHVRWNYLTPDHQVLISDGETISMYFEKLNQMIITQVDESQTDILFALFSGETEISDTFTILDTTTGPEINNPKDETGLKEVNLIPKAADSQIRTIRLWATGDLMIRRLELIDHFDTTTTINISDIRENPVNIKDRQEIDSYFSFTPPQGTEIIKQ